jgi:protein-disulfide isomerase
MIESYLLENPQILEEMSARLQAQQETQNSEQAKLAIKRLHNEIYNDEDDVVLGNPNGDVTLVEFFDYNCPFCRQVMPHIPALIDSDPNLRVIIKELPVLGQNSFEAAGVSIAVNIIGADYWAFHEKLFSERGPLTLDKALQVAQDMGINIADLEKAVTGEKINEILQKTNVIAYSLGINGTPAFIIGDEIIPGAVDLEQLEAKIKNMRECGKATCE